MGVASKNTPFLFTDILGFKDIIFQVDDKVLEREWREELGCPFTRLYTN